MLPTPLPDLTAARHLLLERNLIASGGDVVEAGAGAWSVAYGFDDADGAPRVIRFGRLRDDFERDRLAAAFASPRLPIPRVTEIGEALGGFYAISQRMAGDFLDELDGDAMRATLPSVLHTLDVMRAADLSATTGFGSWDATGDGAYASWTEMLLDIGSDPPGGRTHGWRERLAASPLGVEPFDRALAELQTLAPRLQSSAAT